MINRSNKCVECHACVQACPQSCISFSPRGEIEIDYNTCVHCNLCESVCQITGSVSFYSTNKVYAAVCKDEKEERMSSSGGMAYLLYQKVLEEDGVVFGVAYSSSFVPVFESAEKEENVFGFLKSKYSFSYVGNAFKQCQDYCEMGIKVLFVGLPCQIAGLKLFLKKEYDNLVIVDILCHGAPHYSIFQNHIKYLEKKRNKEVVDYQFRDKKNSEYGPYSYYIKYSDEKSESGSALWDAYYNAFFKANIFRDVCYTCHYARRERVSDITIGDFWRAGETVAALKDRRYISSIIVSSDKGAILLEKCKSNILLFESTYEDLSKSTHAVVSPSMREREVDIKKLQSFKEYCKWASKYENGILVRIRKLRKKMSRAFRNGLS